MDINKLLSVYRKASETEINRIKTHTIGALAKKRRKSLHMTQGEVADEICSVSYLSKVETNKIIPNERCVTALMERVKISKWEIYTIENSKELIELAIKSLLYNEKDEYKELYERVESINTNQCADVIKIGYYLLNNDLDRAEELISENMIAPSSMDKYVLSFYLYLSSLYFLKMGEYKDLEAVLNEEKSMYSNEDLMLLYDELSFSYYSQVKRPVLAKEAYDHLISVYKDKMVYKKIDELVINYSLFLLNENEYHKAIEALSLLRKEELLRNNPLYNYILAKSYYMLNKKISAKEYLDLITTSSYYYQFVLDLKYNTTDNTDQLIEEVSNALVDKPSFYLDYFLKSKAGLISRKLFESKEYRDLYSSSDYYIREDMLLKERQYLIDNKKYKDAIAIDKRIERLSNEIKKE